jgi:hypothetical protein
MKGRLSVEVMLRKLLMNICMPLPYESSFAQKESMV